MRQGLVVPLRRPKTRSAHKEPTQFEFVIRSVVPRFLLEDHCSAVSAVSTVAGLWVKRRGEGYG